MVSEATVSMILDTYMYTNYSNASDGQTLREIVEQMPQNIDVNDRYYKEYTILKDAVRNDQIGDLKICCQAQNMGYNEGTNAVTFVNEKTDTNYVIYRGTADGEWLDNGKGITAPSTKQQAEAVAYFDEVVETLGIKKGAKVYISGHSKGGNKVQYVTMDSMYSSLITACYSIDGQGMSDKAIEMWTDRYSEAEYKERQSKIYGINGQNDFVSVLGNCIILENQISYVSTPCPASDVAGFHDITMMFAQPRTLEDGSTVYDYSSIRNEYVTERGQMGEYAAKLSESLMALPEGLADGSAATLMQLVEILNGGHLSGLDGTTVSLSELKEFKNIGVPIIINSLFGDKEGQRLIKGLLENEGLVNNLYYLEDLEVDYLALFRLSEELNKLADSIKKILWELSAAGTVIPLFFDGYSYRRPHIENSVVKLAAVEVGIKAISKLQMTIGKMYEDFDNKDFGF